MLEVTDDILFCVGDGDEIEFLVMDDPMFCVGDATDETVQF